MSGWMSRLKLGTALGHAGGKSFGHAALASTVAGLQPPQAESASRPATVARRRSRSVRLMTGPGSPSAALAQEPEAESYVLSALAETGRCTGCRFGARSGDTLRRVTYGVPGSPPDLLARAFVSLQDMEPRHEGTADQRDPAG